MIFVLYIGPLAVAGTVLWITVCPSFHPSVVLSRSFLGIASLVFSETQHDVRGPCGVACGRARFFGKKMCHKCIKNGPKIGLFKFIGKFSHWFFLNLVIKEGLYYLLNSCTNLILMVPEIWAKILSANQIARYLNRIYLQNKIMKKPDFCMLIQIQWNWRFIEKYWGGRGQK